MMLKNEIRNLQRRCEQLKKEVDLWKRQSAFESEHREKYRQRCGRLLAALRQIAKEPFTYSGAMRVAEAAIADEGEVTP
jgi:hypothetical protein